MPLTKVGSGEVGRYKNAVDETCDNDDTLRFRPGHVDSRESRSGRRDARKWLVDASTRLVRPGGIIPTMSFGFVI